jgi:hypothetical protein
MTPREYVDNLQREYRTPYSFDYVLEDGSKVAGVVYRDDVAIGYREMRRGYNRTDYYGVTLVFGQWPSDREVGEMLGAVSYCGGAQVSTVEDGTKYVSVAGCD